MKAKGKCKKKKKTTVVRDSEGHEITRVDVEEEKKIKKFIYKLEIGDNKIPIKLHGSVNHGDTQLRWSSPHFEAEVGGFFSPKPHIKTKSQEYPAMDLLLAFIICNMFAPSDIKNNCHAPFNF